MRSRREQPLLYGMCKQQQHRTSRQLACCRARRTELVSNRLLAQHVLQRRCKLHFEVVPDHQSSKDAYAFLQLQQ